VKVALSPAVIEGEGDFAGLTGAVPGLFPVPTQEALARRTEERNNRAAAGSIVFALIFNVLLFVAAPLLLTNALSSPLVGQRLQREHALRLHGSNCNTRRRTGKRNVVLERVVHSRTYLHPVRPSVAFNLIDGLIRMTFFLIMIFSFSLLKDIRRVFQYHGAEHKTVFTWEAGLPLTVENARPQPRQHPRCGTSFLMVVMLVAIVLFSVIKFDSLLLNFLIRIALMPVVAGLSYEIIRLSAKKESSWFFKLMTKPGVWLQNITTQEPDDQQLEVAIEALKESLKLEPHDGRTVAGAALVRSYVR
jgi:uncharacterized protein YqhQ